MTETIAPQATEALVHLDPSAVVIGTNVRLDVRADEKEFRKSIRERGVLEAVTVYLDAEGQYVLLRGQRRTVTAAEVGTPTGLIPARVVPEPDEADRIGDQMVENIHRAAMREGEILAGVEQLALLGVSAAQIAKRTSIDRTKVNAALAVTGSETRQRVDTGDLTLEEAAIFAEFEGDEAATERLNRRKGWGQSIEHEAQRLRDEAAERAAYDAEVERLQAEGLPVLSGEDAEEHRHALRCSRLLTAEGEPVSEENWSTVPSAAVLLVEDWIYPEAETDTEDDEEAYVEPSKALVPVWVVTDPDAASEAGFTVPTNAAEGGSSRDEEETDEQAEARREERRRVIANNKAWASAETVRREWLAEFVTRKTAPKGAEALICAAVVRSDYGLQKAMESRHPMLRTLTGIGAGKSRWDSCGEIDSLIAKATSPKAETMAVLAAVVAAWEGSIGKQTWRNPTPWDARVLGALMAWGYKPSEVERLLLGEEPPEATGEHADEDADQSGSAA